MDRGLARRNSIIKSRKWSLVVVVSGQSKYRAWRGGKGQKMELGVVVGGQSKDKGLVSKR